MKNYWFLILFVFSPYAMRAQSDTTRILHEATSPERTSVTERSVELQDTPEAQDSQDSLTRVEVTTIHYFTDTLTRIVSTRDSIAQQREEVIPTDSTERRGHYIEAYIGASYGSLGYGFTDDNSRVNGFISPLLQLQYAYFFHPNVGVGIGAWFTTNTSYAHLGGTYTWEDKVDTDLEQHYTHTSEIVTWKERQTIHNIAIPISLQFQYRKEGKKAGLFGAVGVAPSFAVMNSYRVTEGQVTHSGYYPAWNLTLENMHEFGTKDYTQEESAKGKLAVNPQAIVFADLGAIIALTRQIDLYIGGYFQCGANDANKSEKHDLGWKDDDFSFMEDYTGSYALNSTKSSHPYEVGLKVGIHWHHIKPDKHETVDYFDYFTRQDTLVDLLSRQDTVISERIDTILRAHTNKPIAPTSIRKVAEEVEKFNKIYFAFDSYVLTNKAKAYLNSIVEALNGTPEAKIRIEGHASSEGQSEYNDILSANRAKAVANYLVRCGVDKNRIVTEGYGSRVPNEDTEREAMNRDRRVEVKVIQESENQ